ncbi:MAG: hypothetical protein ACXAC5_01365 [Promethearchaeota archaeon]|jgi:hypothetical protein
MIDKRTQRYIKEGLLAIFRDNPQAMDYPVYYLPMNEPTNTKSIKQLGMAIRSLHGIPEIPWPEQNCIICTEDHVAAMLEYPIQTFILFLHEDKMNKRFNCIPRDKKWGPTEFMTTYVVFVDQKRGAIRTFSEMVTMTHITEFDAQVDTETSIANQISRMPSMNREQERRLRTYWLSYCNGTMEEGWLARRIGRQQEFPNPYGDAQMGLASDILGYLANVAVPCHYFVQTTFPEGFGPGPVRRAMRDKPIFSVIAYDRLHRTFIGDVEHQGGTKAAHFRHGHLRHHWKRAGINRFSLPDDPFERLKIVHQRRVERSYVTPTWVGETEYIVDGVVHRIITEDIPLGRIGRDN